MLGIFDKIYNQLLIWTKMVQRSLLVVRFLHLRRREKMYFFPNNGWKIHHFPGIPCFFRAKTGPKSARGLSATTPTGRLPGWPTPQSPRSPRRRGFGSATVVRGCGETPRFTARRPPRVTLFRCERWRNQGLMDKEMGIYDDWWWSMYIIMIDMGVS